MVITSVEKLGRGCKEIQREGVLNDLLGHLTVRHLFLSPRLQWMGVCHEPKNWSLVCGLPMPSVGFELYFLCNEEYRPSINLRRHLLSSLPFILCLGTQ